MKTFKIISILSVLFLANCAKKQEHFIRMPEEIKEEIKSFDIVIPRCQENLQAQIDESKLTAMGGGLVGALVDSMVNTSRKNSANTSLVKINDCLCKTDVESLIAENFLPEFKNNLKGLKNIIFLSNNEKDICDKALKKSKSDAVIFLRFTYNLNPDFSTLTGKLYITVYAGNKKMKSMVKDGDYPIYKTNISSSKTLLYKHTNIAGNAEVWAYQDGKRVKESMHEIIADIKSSLDKKLKNSHIL